MMTNEYKKKDFQGYALIPEGEIEPENDEPHFFRIKVLAVSLIVFCLGIFIAVAYGIHILWMNFV